MNRKALHQRKTYLEALIVANLSEARFVNHNPFPNRNAITRLYRAGKAILAEYNEVLHKLASL